MNTIKNLISIGISFLVFKASSQNIESDLLLKTAHGATTSRADIIGTPEEGTFFFDANTKGAYVFTENQWRKVYYAPLVKPQTADYTLTTLDDGNVLTFNSNTDVTLTVPSGLETGFNISLYQIGNGRVTIVGAAGVSVLNRLSRFRTAGTNSGVGIICIAPNVFQVTGDLKK